MPKPNTARRMPSRRRRIFVSSTGRRVRARSPDHDPRLRSLRLRSGPDANVIRALGETGESQGYPKELASDIAAAEEARSAERRRLAESERTLIRPAFNFERLPAILSRSKIRQVRQVIDPERIAQGHLLEIQANPADVAPEERARRRFSGGATNFAFRANSPSVLVSVIAVNPSEVGSGHTIVADVLYDFDASSGQYAKRNRPEGNAFYTTSLAAPRIKQISLVELDL